MAPEECQRGRQFRPSTLSRDTAWPENLLRPCQDRIDGTGISVCFERNHRVPLHWPPPVCERRQKTRLLGVAADLLERSERRGGHVLLSVGHCLREVRHTSLAADPTERGIDVNQILG